VLLKIVYLLTCRVLGLAALREERVVGSGERRRQFHSWPFTSLAYAFGLEYSKMRVMSPSLMLTRNR
jgi:hypothetical protein